jgi:hypothetical protein
MRKLVFVSIVTAMIVSPLAVMASHQFTDVPDSNIFHDDIGWMADNGITRGCNPPDNDEYCPDRELIRGEEAAFFHRYDGYLRDSIEPRMLPTDCEAGQVAEYDGEAWQCADSGGGLTATSGETTVIEAGDTAQLSVSCEEGESVVSAGVTPDDALIELDTDLVGDTADLTVSNVGTEAAEVTPYAVCASL